MRLASVILMFATMVSSGARADDNVRVKLLHLPLPIEVEGAGITVKGVKRSDITRVSIPSEEKTVVDARRVAGRMIWFVKKDDRESRVSVPLIEIEASSPKIRIDGYEVPAPVLISTALPSRGVDVIAALKLNDYLAGVLSGEMPASWPIEALKAQAVAARSYTLHQIQNRPKALYQLEGSVLDQVFSVSLPASQMEKIRRAVEDTENLVLLENHKILKAYYHSDCGGQTEDPSVIWGNGHVKAGKLDSVIDTQCAFNPAARWTFSISLDDLGQKIASWDHGFGLLKSVRVLTRTPSQRAGLLALNDGAREIRISGNDFRRLVGFNKLKSTLFTVEQKQKTLTFKGRGFGHGSGLCQWGARFMAEHGASAEEILSHYYPSARLSELHVANR